MTREAGRKPVSIKGEKISTRVPSNYLIPLTARSD
jgi:hypothetical protein